MPKIVRMELASMKPDGTLYKGIDAAFTPPLDQPIFVDFDVDNDDAHFVKAPDGRMHVTLTLDAIMDIGLQIHEATKIAMQEWEPSMKKRLADRAKQILKEESRGTGK